MTRTALAVPNPRVIIANGGDTSHRLVFLHLPVVQHCLFDSGTLRMKSWIQSSETEKKKVQFTVIGPSNCSIWASSLMITKDPACSCVYWIGVRFAYSRMESNSAVPHASYLLANDESLRLAGNF